jgi:hypothetical protein
MRQQHTPAAGCDMVRRRVVPFGLALCASLMLAASGLCGEAPTVTPFDGQYFGGATLMHAGATCDPVGVSATMTIVNAQATIDTVQSTGQPGITFAGAVDRSGTVQAVERNLIVGSEGTSRLRLEAKITAAGVSGNISGAGCDWELNLVKK